MLPARHASECPFDEFSAYIDGELEPRRELELEEHLAICPSCVVELNQQKLFLHDLTSSLMEDSDLAMPVDFAKHVAVNAESSVIGLRRRGERFNAVLICLAMLIVVLVALSVNAGDPAPGAAFDQATAVIGFIAHLAYSFSVGLVVILRSIAGQAQGDGSATAPAVFLLLVALIAVSLRVLSVRRA
jgi:anti-sigma factor RsiW